MKEISLAIIVLMVSISGLINSIILHDLNHRVKVLEKSQSSDISPNLYH